MPNRRIVLFSLCALFIAAIAARVSTTDPLDSPYFKGASAMAYRHMLAVSEGHSLTARDDRAGHPDGYVPARYRAAGAETLTGLAYRAVGLVSDLDGRPFARRMTVFIAALCVFTAYAVASRVWNSAAAGLLAAFLVAFLPALVSATNGRTFSHAVFASFFASLYAALALRALPSSSPARPVIAALVSVLLLWVWEPARYGLAAWVTAIALAPGIERRTRIVFVVAHAVVVVAATLVMPHLAALRAIGAWTTAVALAAVVVAVLPESRRRGWKRAAYLAALAAFLTVIATPVRAGASEQFPALQYVLLRIRHLFGPPDPTLLPDWMRHLWSKDHAPLSARESIVFLLPILFCAAAWAINREARAWRPRFAATVALFLLASLAALVDRSVLPAASVAMIVMVSGAAVAFDWRRRTRTALIALGGYTALSGVVFAGKPADLAHRVARTAPAEASSFIWISFENTDRELVRFISTRTSVSESILATDDLSALLLAFTGRASVQLPGTTSREPSLRHVELARALYRDENSLYEVCRREQIDYVVYSIDVMLDGGPYSPSWLAAVSALDPSSIGARMHFDPESLRHFTLMYENDHYRLFKVTAGPQPVFLTDHPLFYQPELFARDGADLEHFRNHVVWLMGTYANAADLRARGRAEEARRMFDVCIRQAPKFTRARLGMADALMDLGRYQAARDQLAAVIRYAPDNPAALYAAAYVQVLLDQPDAARPFLQLLAQTGDAATIEKGRALQYYIDNKIPLKPGAPQ